MSTDNAKAHDDDWVDPREFLAVVRSAEEVTDRPEEYLPGTDPNAPKNRNKNHHPYGGHHTSVAQEEAANRRVDDWIGGSPQTAKRSWKVKSKTTSSTSPTKETSASNSSPTNVAPTSSPTGQRRWHPPAKSEAVLPPWASPPSEPSKTRTQWKPKVKHVVPPPVNVKQSSDDQVTGTVTVTGTDTTPSAEKEEEPKNESPPKAEEKAVVEEGDQFNNSTEHTHASTVHPHDDENEDAVGACRHLHDSHDNLDNMKKEKEEEEEVPSSPTPVVVTAKTSPANRKIEDGDGEDDDDDDKPDPALFKMMYLQEEGDSRGAGRVDEYLPGTAPSTHSSPKKKHYGGGGYGSPGAYSGTSRVDDWLGSSPTKAKRSWKPKP